MKTEFGLNGEKRPVALRRDGRVWIAVVGGRELVVDVAESGGWWSLLVGAPAGGHHAASLTSYDISIDAGAEDHLVVHVNGTPVSLSVLEPRAAFQRHRHHGGAGAGPQTIVAPMPGRIVKVLVKPGEIVQPHQGVIIVEAMKMQNELRAPRAGTVTDVRVAEGASVEANAVLVVLE